MRKRQAEFIDVFKTIGNLSFCCDIEMVMSALDIQFDPTNWRLFIDSSKASLKAVLLHNGNIHPSIPIAYSTSMKESYESMRVILDHLQYQKYEWPICGDLKVVGLMMGLQLGFTKHGCFICEWDSRAREQHYVRTEWPKRKNYAVGQKNVQSAPLVDPIKVLLPPLHLKLGLVKNFIKAVNKDPVVLAVLCQLFPHISMEKIKAGENRHFFRNE